jgi:hypothetical protein
MRTASKTFNVTQAESLQHDKDLCNMRLEADRHQAVTKIQ